MMHWNPPRWVPLTKFFCKVFFRLRIFFFRNKFFFFKEQLLFSFLCIVKQKKISEWSENFWKFLIFKNHKVNWDPPWRISIHRNFDSLGGPLSPCGSHWLLFKSVLAHCEISTHEILKKFPCHFENSRRIKHSVNG